MGAVPFLGDGYSGAWQTWRVKMSIWAVLITRATCGRPSLSLPFHQSFYLSFYLSCRVWENYPEVLAYSFDEKAVHKVFKRTDRQECQVFWKMSSNELLARTLKIQINAYADCSSLPASYPRQFNTRRLSTRLPENIEFDLATNWFQNQ